MRNLPPPIAHILAEREADVRKLADKSGLAYTVHLDPRPDIVEFRFARMSEDAVFAFFSQVPDDAFAYRAFVTTTDDPEPENVDRGAPRKQ